MIIAAASLFFGAFILLSLFSWLLRKILGATGLGFVDRLFGFFLGLARGVVILAILAMLASSTSLPKERFWGDSELLPYVLKASDTIRRFMPDSLSTLFAIKGI